MPRKKNVIPSHQLLVRLPEPILARMNLHLYSDVEQRIPLGSHQRFLSQLINEFFSRKALDVSSFLGQPPGTSIVLGDAATIQSLTNHLEANK